MVYRIEYQRPYSRLEANRNLDGNILDIKLADEAPEPGLITTPGTEAVVAGKPIIPTHLPSKMMIGGGSKAVTDYVPDNGLIIVSDRFKVLIEGLEPDVHQFFPVKLVDGKGHNLADHWYWVVCNRIDSVDRALTTLFLWKGVIWRRPSHLREDEIPPGIDRSLPPRLVFNSQQIGLKHFWRDKYLPQRGLYCSDQAASGIRQIGLAGVELIEEETV